jgi:2-polyprenyl-6-methoxyphenol hydroxylase-like FAD-dependent oxidoreductase
MIAADFAPVLIVGAGPSGMTAALDLAHYQIPSILLDEDHALSEGSRAIAYHHTTLAVWEKLGAADAMLRKGIAWTTRHTYFRTRELFSQQYPPPPEGLLPGFLNLQQYYVERYLLDRIEATPIVDLRWDHRVVGVEQEEQDVLLEVETRQGRRRFRGTYVIAADGARSTLRRLLHLDFPGTTHADRFLIADIRAELKLPPEPRFFFDHPTNPGYTLLVHPQPDGVWRIDWQIGARSDPEWERGSTQMDQRIRALIGEVPYQIVWLSDYRFHQRLLERFRHGRIFFVGDAAHLVSPFGARGLNSAVQDVENLVWKIAFVLKGYSPPALLDSYQTERWSAQRENQRITNRTMLFMAPPTPWRRLIRNTILALSTFFPTARKWVDSGRMSEPYVYTKSAFLVADDEPRRAWRGTPRLGAQLPDLMITLNSPEGQRRSALRRLLGAGYVLLYFGKSSDECRRVLQQVNLGLPAFPLASYAVLDTVIEGLSTIEDSEGNLTRCFRACPGTALVVRPDRHLAARRHKTSPAQIREILLSLLYPGR